MVRNAKSFARMKRFFAVLVAILLVGIGMGTPVLAAEKSVEKLSVSVETKTLYVGQKVNLKVVIAPSGASQKVTFRSDNPKIVSVSDKGVVTAKKIGTAKITIMTAGKNAAGEKLSKTVTFTVKDSVRSLSVKAEKKKLVVGENITLKPVVLPETAPQGVAYKSSDKEVIGVSASGFVTAKKPGIAKITVTTSGKNAEGKKLSKTVIITVLDDEKESAKDGALVSEPLKQDPMAYKITKDSTYIQNPENYFGTSLQYKSSKKSGDYQIWKFSGKEADRAVVEAYLDAICDGKHNLKITDTYDFSYKSTFFSYAIDYTGTGNVRSSMTANYTDTVCNLSVYGVIERGKMEVNIYIPQDMEQVDLGMRYQQPDVSVGVGGMSAMAGLYKQEDGSFQTTDGRLSTKLGEAMVLRDGETYTTKATMVKGKTRDELWVKDFYRDEAIVFFSPANRLLTGDIYLLKDLFSTSSVFSKANTLKTADQFGNYNWTLFFGVGHNGNFIAPVEGSANKFKDLTVRVMYLEKNVEAVYYIYAEFDSEPYTFEALCAVDLRDGTVDLTDSTVKDSSVKEKNTIARGESLKISCPTKYDTNYELFKWEIVEGASLAEISGTVSKTCTVKAKKAGTVRLKVTYEYGIDEPDVLTGIDRNVNRSETHEYLIRIEEN